jgi:hypothetical protein
MLVQLDALRVVRARAFSLSMAFVATIVAKSVSGSFKVPHNSSLVSEAVLKLVV